MNSPGIAQLATDLESALGAAAGVRAAYLFGSALTSATPQDVDVLIVYGPPLVPATAPEIRPLVDAAVSRAFSLPAHLMFLSEAEAREPGLIARLEPRFVYGKPVA